MRPLAILFALVLLGGCLSSKPRWWNPNLPEAQWSKDAAACKRWASAEAGQEYRRDQDIEADRDLDGGTYSAQMGRHDTRRRAVRLEVDCMRARGYRPMTKK